MEVFDFMVSIKEKLQEEMPETVVCVEPHDRGSVSIRVEWRIIQRYCMHQIVSVADIERRKDNIVEHYVAFFKHLKTETEAKYAQASHVQGVRHNFLVSAIPENIRTENS